MVTIGPMSQVGWASASFGVTSVSVVPGSPAERPAACGDDQPPDLVRAAPAQALRERRVLRVDRDDLPGLGRGGHHVAADDERLLVRQRERRTGTERRQRRAQTDGSRDGVQHRVAWRGRHSFGRVRADEHPREPPLPVRIAAALRLGVERELQVLGRGAAGDAEQRNCELDCLVREQLGVRARGQADDAEPVRMIPDDVQCLGADRARAAEDDDIADVTILDAGHESRHTPILPPRSRRTARSTGGRPQRGRPVSTITRSSVKSAMAERRPSRPTPHLLGPAVGHLVGSVAGHVTDDHAAHLELAVRLEGGLRGCG